MKFFLSIFLSILSIFILIGCTTPTVETRKTLLNVLNNLDVHEVDVAFKSDLENYSFRGDSYSLIGKLNKDIKLTMYYKEKLIEFHIKFCECDREGQLIVENINIQYIDLIEDIYLNIVFKDQENPYTLSDTSYDRLFYEIEALSIKDIEWILIKLKLL